MRNLHRALLAGSLGFAVALVAGCGGSGSGLLTGDQASGLQNELNRISSALSAGDCSTVRSATRGLAAQVASLPATVNGNLRGAIVSEANQVNSLSVGQCHPVTTTRTQTTPATTTSTPTTTTPATTPTTPTQTTTTPTTPTTPATTPTTPGNSSGGGGLPGGTGGGAGVGGGNGNGNGNGQ
jgi:hypothetical protein